MTVEEMIDRIDEEFSQECDIKCSKCSGCPIKDDFNEIVKTLEKQIAKKPIHNHHCPSCDEALPIKGITDDYCSECFNWNYCPNCGQKLDWE